MFDFKQILAELNNRPENQGNFAARIAQAEAVPADFLFNRILPERLKPTYSIDAGSIVLYPTMVGTVAMDSPYKPIGVIKGSSFSEKTAKFGSVLHFPEELLRELQQVVLQIRGGLGAAGVTEKQILIERVIGVTRMSIRSHVDRMEWLRGRALIDHLIDWNHSGIDLNVDYLVNALNTIDKTGSATQSYGGNASTFWADRRTVRKRLGTITATIMNINSFEAIISQNANNIRVLSQTEMGASIAMKDASAPQLNDSDARNRSDIVFYNKSASITDGKGGLFSVPFINDGEILNIGMNNNASFDLTSGSVDDPMRQYELGYTHIAPTVEGGNMGRWARTYVPENEEYTVVNKAVTNGLPVITNPDKMMTQKFAMPA